MKKIIPFNNVVNFDTDVREITAISLEHEIKKYPDMISGVFYISGEYKMTEGILDRERFDFELPFDIALTNSYDLDSLLVDIDDFRYDLISDKSLKVNIDLYIDGEELEEPLPRNTYTEELPETRENKDTIDLTDDTIEAIYTEDKSDCKEQTETCSTYEKTNNEEEIDKPIEIPKTFEEPVNEDVDNDFIEPERIDLLKDMLTNNKENEMTEDLNININNNNENINTNIFTPTQEEEKYVTYRVYKVLETDTLDSILTKYNVTKEMLSDYNNIENITPGDKLIIPTNEK